MGFVVILVELLLCSEPKYSTDPRQDYIAHAV